MIINQHLFIYLLGSVQAFFLSGLHNKLLADLDEIFG